MENKVLSFLVAPQSVEEFKENYWGKKPLVCRGSPQRKEIFCQLFSWEKFEDLVKTGAGQLRFGSDILTGRYKNGIRERPIPPVCDLLSVRNLFSSGCTLQVVQPQRYVSEMSEICVRLESVMECLVGCNAYLTPKKTQGLAPHHDDVELFVFQTQGSKKWKLYEPIKGFVLPNVPSKDLEQKEVGPLIMEVELREGDVLYMPKGIVHQAKAQEEDSVHLTISTYQRWSWGDLLSTLVSDTLMASSEPVCLPVRLREELPMGFLSKVGRYVGYPEETKQVAKGLANRLRDLADAVESKTEILQSTVDLMSYQFLTSRMPPPDSFIPDQENYPELTDKVKVTDPGMFRILPVVDQNGNQAENCVQVVSCLKNDIQTHMMETVQEGEDSKEEMLIFSVDHKEALMQILSTNGAEVNVKDLCLPTDKQKIKLVSSLWEEGIIYIV